jgi:hypothetical protein
LIIWMSIILFFKPFSLKMKMKRKINKYFM